MGIFSIGAIENNELHCTDDASFGYNAFHDGDDEDDDNTFQLLGGILIRGPNFQIIPKKCCNNFHS